MIDLELDKLKLLNADLAEGTIGQDRPQREGYQQWDPLGSYLAGLAPERQWSLTHPTEQRALAWIAERLPQGSLVVEVGSFLGCSAAIIAQANPSLEIKAIDLWDTDDDSQRNPMQIFYADLEAGRIDAMLGSGQRRTRDRVAQRLAHYPNIEFLEGQSPVDFEHCGLRNISLYIEDADHRDPGLRANIDFWSARVKLGGLAMLHDHRPWLPEHYADREQMPIRFPDVEAGVERLINQGWQLEATVSSWAILRKPTRISLVG